MRVVFLFAICIVTAACGTMSGPPTMPLTPGADAVEIRDTDTIKKRPVDTSECSALGSVEVGPVADNNMEVAIKNETFAKGGNFFFGTSYGLNYGMWTVTGMAYDCPSLRQPQPSTPPAQ